jgi:hypothetical protein
MKKQLEKMAIDEYNSKWDGYSKLQIVNSGLIFCLLNSECKFVQSVTRK